MKLSEENIKKLVFGGIYTAERNKVSYYCTKYGEQLNDQRYGWFVPVHTYNDETKEEKYFMIDTYQINRDAFQYSSVDSERYANYIKGLELMDNPKEKGNWVSGMPFDYYYVARVELTDNNIGIFELKADLHNYEPTNDSNSRNYNEEDILNYVRLYNEHCYSSGGMTLVKKSALINYKNKINAKLDDILRDIKKPNSAYESDIQKLLEIEKEAINKNANYNKKRLDTVVKYNDIIKKLEKTHDEYYNKIRNDLYFYDTKEEKE